ncbi:hypothetical protein MIMGU_mgv1a001469mg [Erythranthe guttata]|uniref:Ubiquitinyl hydrolase 1 n=1 Tax=Erythranthe guttata TaxID=4155 RepID=A0A022RG18_ERYGU|nr:hypothetical protein MIMGU_mgv1a001469mg [Erythranthe guttata]
MLVIVVILLIFGAVVRRKWGNEAAKREEILRLVAAASEEEAEIAKIQAVDGYDFRPEPPPQQLEKKYYCAVCCCPTTTRCAQCKAVRYCSGKCQIIHWRQGHKDDCLPATLLQASQESEFVVETATKNQSQIDFNTEAKFGFDPTQHLGDTGSSSSSSPCFSSSSGSSEISFDASATKVLESNTPTRPDKLASDSVELKRSHSISDSDELDIPSLSPLNSTVSEVNYTPQANKIKRTKAAKPDEGFQTTSIKDRRTCSGAAVLEGFVPHTTESKSFQSNSSLKTSSSMKAQPSSSTHLCKEKETRPMLSRSSENNKVCAKMGSTQNLLSDSEGVQTLSQPTSNTLKTSVRKIVQHFKVPKQSKSYTFDTGKDSAYNHKMIFSPKLFIQLYSCTGLELHPVGLFNCGNSCYANAVLQCLAFTRPVASYLLQGLHSKTCKYLFRGWCLICEFEHLIRKGQETNSPLSPVGILSQIQRIGSHLSHGRQEDAHDFLRNVVDTMQSIWLEEACVSGSIAENSTLLGQTFGGYLRSKIKCMKCSRRSEQCDRMMDLTGLLRSSPYLKHLVEMTNTFHCRCKSYEKAKKKLTVIEAPNILTIVLKRFRSGNSEKLSKPIQFPEFLNLAPYMSGKSDKYPIYNLYAVVVHSNTMNAAYSGHYISYVKDFRGEWFRIDDTRVSRVDLATVLSVEAYILFYSRHTPRGPSLLTNIDVYSDGGKTKRNTEAVSASTIPQKKNWKFKSSSSDWSTESPHDLTNNHILDYDKWGFRYKKNHILDSSSDNSSIFSASDAGSYSTDSTKDSSAEDLSGYIFGPRFYGP